MKILGGDLEQTSGEVAIENGLRLGKLRQDQFAYEDQRVIDVVMMGHTEMWAAMSERDAIYANPEASEDDYMHAAELEAKFAEYDGYTAEARAGELLMGVGIPVEQHAGPMSEVAPGWNCACCWRRRCSPIGHPVAGRTDQQPGHQHHPLAGTRAQRAQRHHDHHFARPSLPELGVHPYGGLGLQHHPHLPGQLRRLHDRVGSGKERQLSSNSKAKERIQELQEFVARFSANKSKARQATSRLKQVDKLKSEMVEVKPSSRQNPFIRFEMDDKFKLHRQAVEVDHLNKAYDSKVLFRT